MKSESERAKIKIKIKEKLHLSKWNARRKVRFEQMEQESRFETDSVGRGQYIVSTFPMKTMVELNK